ncbi:hypothetical protein D3C85_875880 [compost metagenome]
MQLFVEARHTAEVVRLYLVQRPGHFVDVWHIGGLCAAPEALVLADHPFADVGHRQEGEPGIARRWQPVGVDRGQQVAVAEHRRLGLAGGPRGEHQIGQDCTVQRLPALPDLRGGDIPTLGAEGFQRLVAAVRRRLVEADDAQARDIQRQRMSGMLDEQQPAVGALQLLGCLGGGEARVEPDTDGADAEHCEVEQAPFQARAAPDRHPVPRLHAGREQGPGQRLAAAGDLAPVQGLPAVGITHPGGGRVRRVVGPPGEQGGNAGQIGRSLLNRHRTPPVLGCT